MLHFHRLHCEIRFIDIRVIESIVLLRSILAVPNTYMSFSPLSCRKILVVSYGFVMPNLNIELLSIGGQHNID